MKRIRSLHTLFPYLKHYRAGLALGFLYIVSVNFFSAQVPQAVGVAIDSPGRGELVTNTLIILGFAAAAGIFRFLMRNQLIGISRKIEFELRNDYFRHLEFQPQEFFSEHRTGDLMSRATNDLNAVRMVLGPGIMYSVNTVILFLFVIPKMISINSSLTLLAMLPFPLLAVLINRFGVRIHHWFEKIQAQMSSISARAQENLSGIRVIKAYTREQSEIDSFRTLNREYISLNRNLIRTQSLFMPTIQFLSGIGFVLVLYYGGRGVIDNTITFGEFAAFNTYLVMLIWPVIATGWVVNIFQRAAASMGRINQILEILPKIDDSAVDESIDDVRGKIEFRNLTFAYGDQADPVLHDINLRIPEGETAAVIGPTGSGKSTLVNMIPRIFDPPPGAVFIDGRDVRTIPVKLLRENIGFVPQETFLFSDSIKENIVFGIDRYDERDILEAVEISQLRENIEEFPNGYETMLGERGINLSGGQKQRAAISRAVIRHPKILILDDALSSVDTKTEEAILTRLRDVMRDRTSIIISHRVSTVREADRIYVLDDGRIVEEGKHDELLAANGIYAELHRKQLLSEELEQFDE